MTAIALGVLMWLLARNTPGFSLAPELRLTALIVLLGAGAAIGFAGIWSFRRASTTVNPWRPHASSALVVSGVYRWTRNPMYLGLLLALAGWGLYLANLYSLLPAFTFVPYMNRFQIRPEERALQQTWGPEFIDYCQRVRRWL
jgi:protein-S-isoprenylcysteine O-methyltransferase Ste14